MMDELDSNSIGSQDMGRTSIRKEYTYFYNFVKGGNDRLSQRKRETMFINILEGLHPLEAEILMLVKDKKTSDKYKISQKMLRMHIQKLTGVTDPKYLYKRK